MPALFDQLDRSKGLRGDKEKHRSKRGYKRRQCAGQHQGKGIE